MMRSDHDDHDASQEASISAELAALGELPVEDDELRFHRAGAHPRADSDVATVATLAELGRSSYDHGPLSQVENRRTWNRVADRLEASGAVRLTRAVGSRSVWRSVVAGLAMAAGVAVVPRLVVDGPAANATDAAADADGLGRAARTGLEALGDEYDTERARDVLEQYSARMQQETQAR